MPVPESGVTVADWAADYRRRLQEKHEAHQEINAYSRHHFEYPSPKASHTYYSLPQHAMRLTELPAVSPLPPSSERSPFGTDAALTSPSRNGRERRLYERIMVTCNVSPSGAVERVSD